MLFLIIALAGPKIGTEVREVQRQGVNLMVALDLSRSMNTQDVSPSRLNKAKLELNRLVNRLQGDRIGLVVLDRRSTRLNSSHVAISYAVFCLNKQSHV